MSEHVGKFENTLTPMLLVNACKVKMWRWTVDRLDDGCKSPNSRFSTRYLT